MVSCLHVNAHPPLPTLSFAVPGVPSDTFTPSWGHIQPCSVGFLPSLPLSPTLSFWQNS